MSCACAAPALAQGGAAGARGRDETAVLAADRAWAAAIARGDVAALEKLFADEYVTIGNNGAVKDKRQETASLAPAPDITIYYFRTEDVEARAYGYAAVVRGHAVWKIKYEGARHRQQLPLHKHLRQTRRAPAARRATIVREHPGVRAVAGLQSSRAGGALPTEAASSVGNAPPARA